ncbi:MAG: hypothetical protein A2Y17_00595 [Clostridiales bacterium GWF2_38_85]|nr:MAG: hypothetical protein A2Y17_00595 [Clostridiales bacterium GWF2_38_85]HBL84600.1 hypothetical protein [Clostridiales bacterium]
MKFPGLLNDSAYNNITASQITAATVTIRGLMCQLEGLQVYCYTFRSTWYERTSTWASLYPMSWDESLDSKVVHYDGNVSYGFDILDAVQDWKNGTEDINKGILFKASSTIESGSTLISKTFGSFNNTTTSYKPKLEITYNPVNPTVTVSPSSVELNVSGTVTLSATTNPSGLSVGWHTYDPSIASVSSSSVVTGVKAGTTTVIAYLTSNTSIVGYCTVTVKLADGVYYIKNPNDNKYLTATNGGTTGGTSVTLETQKSGDSLFWQKWKVKYVGNGNYIIRPLHVLSLDVNKNIALGVYSSTSYNSIKLFATMGYDTSSNTDYLEQWSLQYSLTAYNLISEVAINGSNMYATVAPDGINVIRSTSSSQKWTFTYISSLAPVTSLTVNSSVVDSLQDYAIPGNINDISQCISFNPSSATDKRVKWTSSDLNVVSFVYASPVNNLTIHSYGKTTITATSYDTGASISFTVLNPLPSGTYCFQNRASSYFISFENGGVVKPYSDNGYSSLDITFVNNNQGYYKITKSGTEYDYLFGEPAWIISGDPNGYIKLIPYFDTAKSLAASSTAFNAPLALQTISTSLLQEWKLIDPEYQDYALLGFNFIPFDGGVIDTSLYLSAANSSMSQMYSFGKTYNDISVEECLKVLNTTEVFVAMTHGSDEGFQIINGALKFEVTRSEISQLYTVDHDALSNLNLVLLVACLTGDDTGPLGAYNTMQTLYNNALPGYVGAQTVVGFTESIPYDDACDWIEGFFEVIDDTGCTIEDAIESANLNS